MHASAVAANTLDAAVTMIELLTLVHGIALACSHEPALVDRLVQLAWDGPTPADD